MTDTTLRGELQVARLVASLPLLLRACLHLRPRLEEGSACDVRCFEAGGDLSPGHRRFWDQVRPELKNR